jgi:hypothetical protein
LIAAPATIEPKRAVLAMREVGSFGTCSESTLGPVPRTTFLIAVFLAGAAVAAAGDVATEVERPVQRLIEGVVLTVLVLGVWVLAARERVVGGLAAPGDVGPRDRVLAAAVVAVAVLAAFLSDGLGLGMAVFLAALAGLVLAARSRV